MTPDINRQQRIRENLELRRRVMEAVRRFFTDSGFLEVETPVRTAAPAPELHIDAIASGDRFLQTSPELYMKRLLAAGYERIFQICKCFRGGERGNRHLPEFTMLEWYAAGADYRQLMDQTEALIRYIWREVRGSDIIRFRDNRITLESPWPRIPVEEAFRLYAAVDMRTAMTEDTFDEAVAFEIEPRLAGDRPVFLYDYPAENTPLARARSDRPDLAERFEVYIAGIEICNAFTELTDAAEQRRRFEAELSARRAAGRPVYPMPEAFLSALPQMPPAAGCALGLDRLMMLLAGAERIDDVVAFVPEEE